MSATCILINFDNVNFASCYKFGQVEIAIYLFILFTNKVG